MEKKSESPEDEIVPFDSFEPRRVLLEFQKNQLDFARKRQRELGHYSLSGYLRDLIAREMEARRG